VTKVVPFQDNFYDGNTTGWAQAASTWTVTDGVAKNVVSVFPARYLEMNNTDPDNEVRFDYINHSNSGTPSFNLLVAEVRRQGSANMLRVWIREDTMFIQKRVNNVNTTIAQDTSVDSDDETLYRIRIVSDDDTITVYRAEEDGLESQVLTATDSALASQTTNDVKLWVRAAAIFSLDNIEVISDDLNTTTVFEYNDANELTKATEKFVDKTTNPDTVTTNTAVTYTYDEWGSNTKKTRGSDVADYVFGYGNMLTQVDSDFPGEGTVDYEYGGNMARRERDVTSGEYAWYNSNSNEDEDTVGVE
jgi:hypothetical protein